MPFEPKYVITPKLATSLMRIEAARQAVHDLPITPAVLASLRETARLHSTHYSTMIEGNRLTQGQVVEVIDGHGRFPGRERDEKEVLGYYAALAKVEQLASAGADITEAYIQLLHALVMGGGRKRVKPSSYRDGQNVIRDSRDRAIVYMPPEAKDVPPLMAGLIAWIRQSEKQGLPCPIRAGIAHYQFATIHPYYDGNGRTARLLTTLILQSGGYGLKGIYSLEEYYARDLGAYYAALAVGPSHNYYMGRVAADVTKWVEYVCEGMAYSFEAVKARAAQALGSGATDRSSSLRKLDPRQRQALSLFQRSDTITSRDVADRFGLSQRTARNLCAEWVEAGLLAMADPAKRSRKYRLAKKYHALLGCLERAFECLNQSGRPPASQFLPERGWWTLCARRDRMGANVRPSPGIPWPVPKACKSWPEDEEPMGTCIAIVTDLIFATRITSTAAKVGAKCQVVRDLGALPNALKSLNPATVLVDMNSDGISPAEAIRTVKAQCPTARVVAFFSHVQTELMEQAKAAGADDTLPQSVFVQRLPELLGAAT